MTSRRLCVVAALAAFGAGATLAHSQVELTTVRRSLETTAHITTSGSGPEDFGRLLYLEDGVFDEAVDAYATAGTLFADADASMDTIVTPRRITGRGDVSLFSADDTGFTKVGGVADATLLVVFQVTDPTEVVLDMRVGRSSNAADQFGLRLTGPDGDLINQTSFGSNADFNRTWTLDPGEYTFRLQTRITWNGNVNRDLNATGFFDGTLWLVPSPSAWLALAALAPVAARRRRG